MCDLDTFTLAKELVAEMSEMIEELEPLDYNDGYRDYLSGSISARGVIVGRLGYNELLANLEWTDC